MKEKQQIEEMANVLKAYTKKNNIMASHVILDDYAEELYSKNYRKQREWISVEERLPDQDGKYLAYYGRRGFIVLSYYHELEGVFGFEHWDVTHWMPLPMPPKGDEGK